jgi:hypothetical protein
MDYPVLAYISVLLEEYNTLQISKKLNFMKHVILLFCPFSCFFVSIGAAIIFMNKGGWVGQNICPRA